MDGASRRSVASRRVDSLRGWPSRSLGSNPRCAFLRKARGFERFWYFDRAGDRSHLVLPTEGVGWAALRAAASRVTLVVRFAGCRLGRSARTHVGLRPPVFKLAAVFCVWLRLALFAYVTWVSDLSIRKAFASGCVRLGGAVGKSLAFPHRSEIPTAKCAHFVRGRI